MPVRAGEVVSGAIVLRGFTVLHEVAILEVLHGIRNKLFMRISPSPGLPATSVEIPVAELCT